MHTHSQYPRSDEVCGDRDKRIDVGYNEEKSQELVVECIRTTMPVVTHLVAQTEAEKNLGSV